MSEPEQPQKPGEPHTFSQEFQHSNVGARVPERVARGAFSTGVLVLQGGAEFVLDFILRMSQPHQVVSRVILPFNLMPQFIEALKANLENHRKMTNPGQANNPAQPTPPPAPPPPVPQQGQPQQKPPSIEEIYQDLKIADEVMAGAYANTVMVVHTVSEFCFDFISNYYPRAVVSARVYMSAPQVPVLLSTLQQSWNNLQLKIQQQQNPPKQ